MRLRYLSGSLRIPPSTTKQILFFAKSCSVCITTLEKCKPIWNETLLSWPISRSIFQQYQHSSHSRFKCSAYYGEMWIGKMNYIGSLASARDRWLRLITDNLAVKYFSALFHLKKRENRTNHLWYFCEACSRTSKCKAKWTTECRTRTFRENLDLEIDTDLWHAC